MKTEGIYFLRWGNLNSVKHKEARGASDDEWIHVAPCYKGIYAFPRGYVEPFLLGGTFKNNRLRLIKVNGEPIDEKEFYGEDWETPKPKYAKLLKKMHIRKKDLDTIDNEDGCFMAYKERPKYFTYSGDIWHHLGEYVDKKDIMLYRHGWYKTSFSVYLKALKRCDINERFHLYLEASKDKRHGSPHSFPHYGSKDYYEVFIEHLK